MTFVQDLYSSTYEYYVGSHECIHVMIINLNSKKTKKKYWSLDERGRFQIFHGHRQNSDQGKQKRWFSIFLIKVTRVPINSLLILLIAGTCSIQYTYTSKTHHRNKSHDLLTAMYICLHWSLQTIMNTRANPIKQKRF